MATPVGFNKPDDFIISHQKEAVKQYHVYDGSDRLSEVYTAAANAEHGDQCLKTTYTYWTSSNRVKLMTETITTWDSSYEA